MQPFTFLKDNEALVIKADRPFKDERFEDIERFVNDLYLIKGPGTYIPRIEETVERKIEALTVLPNNGIVLKAKRNLIDATGKEKIAGEKVLLIKLIKNVVVAQKGRVLLSSLRGDCGLQKGACPHRQDGSPFEGIEVLH